MKIAKCLPRYTHINVAHRSDETVFSGVRSDGVLENVGYLNASKNTYHRWTSEDNTKQYRIDTTTDALTQIRVIHRTVGDLRAAK